MSCLGILGTQHPRKLLLCKDIPLSAQFWEFSLNAVCIETAVLHSGLGDAERIALVRRFNDFSDDLLVLVIMHQILVQRCAEQQGNRSVNCTSFLCSSTFYTYSALLFWYFVPDNATSEFDFKLLLHSRWCRRGNHKTSIDLRYAQASFRNISWGASGRALSSGASKHGW